MINKGVSAIASMTGQAEPSAGQGATPATLTSGAPESKPGFFDKLR
jgi:hypothetical protein